VGVGVQLHAFVSSAIIGSELLASLPALLPGERASVKNRSQPSKDTQQRQ